MTANVDGASRAAPKPLHNSKNGIGKLTRVRSDNPGNTLTLLLIEVTVMITPVPVHPNGTQVS